MKRAFRHLLVCLAAALVLSMAAAPVLLTQSSVVWAKSTTKTKSSAKKANSKKKTKKKNGFVKKNGYWYYYLNGKKQKGWITVGKKKYYGLKKGSNSQKGRLVKGWYKIRKKTYYFREEGKKGIICSLAINGTAKVNGIKCIFDDEGNLVKCKYAKKGTDFVSKVGELARMNQAKNNILASLVVAQACLETGFGRNIYHNNLFGIRQGSGYRWYDSWEESIEDYVNFMHTYIPRIFGVRDWSTACWIIGNAGYAEAGGYGSALVSIVRNYNLTRFNK